MYDNPAGVAQLVERQLPKLTTDSAKNAESKTCGSGTATPSSTPSNTDQNSTLDGDLCRLIDAWPTLPKPLKAGIMAMVGASAPRHAHDP